MWFGEDPKPLFASTQQSSTLMSGCCSWSLFWFANAGFIKASPILPKVSPTALTFQSKAIRISGEIPSFKGSHSTIPITGSWPLKPTMSDLHVVFATVAGRCDDPWHQMVPVAQKSSKKNPKNSMFLQQIMQSPWHVPQNLMTSINQLHYHFWGPEAFLWGGFPKLCQPTNPDVAAS